MRISSALAALSFVPLVMACSDPTTPLTSSREGLISGGPNPSNSGRAEINMKMMDACDPETFNAVLGDGACVRNGGVTFEKFIEQLEKHQKVGSWHFAPGKVHGNVGQTIVAQNNGGEVHTFTNVAAFGGGFVPDLNGLSGNPVPAPECLNFGAIDFIPAGGSGTTDLTSTGTHRYQCCIHPWMRATVQVK